MASSPHVHDIDASQFASRVLERSRSVPVLVDFWAAWCGPCRVLGPLLEKEVDALGGKVELCKVDTDRNQDLAAQFGIRGIPAVKAFRDGRVVDEFTGAIPLPAIREFLTRLVPSDGAVALQAALARLAQGQRAEAEAALRALCEQPEVAGAAALHLAHLRVATDPDEAEALAARVPPTSEESRRLDALTRLIQFARRAPGLAPDAAAARAAANPRDHAALIDQAAALFRAGDLARALEVLLDSVSRNPGFEGGAARRAMLALFDHLEEPGRNTDLAREYRRKLQIVA